jgi:hypothetical protein
MMLAIGALDWGFHAQRRAVHSIKTGLMHCSKTESLFDHLVGAGE